MEKRSRKPWTAEEDQVLIWGRQQQKTWSEIQQFLPGRTAKQCRERWVQHLDPRPGNALGPKPAWTELEDKMIVLGYERFGPKFEKIRCLFGELAQTRSAADIKNRWHHSIQGRLREGMMGLTLELETRKRGRPKKVDVDFTATLLPPVAEIAPIVVPPPPPPPPPPAVARPPVTCHLMAPRLPDVPGKRV